MPLFDSNDLHKLLLGGIELLLALLIFAKIGSGGGPSDRYMALIHFFGPLQAAFLPAAVF